MGLMSAILSGYGIYVLGAAETIVDDTYDGPLMEINFARAASLGFARMDKEALRRKTAPDSERDAINRRIDALSDSFFEDLEVAAQRSFGQRQSQTIELIRQGVVRWNSVRSGPVTAESETELDRLSDQIIGNFDTLVELTADESFIQRRQAIRAISDFRSVSIALTVGAVLVGVTVALLLAGRIVRPLRMAAKVADQIADGYLQTPIPTGGKDETGTLLRSMTVMQDNIREMLELEVTRRQSAQGRLIDALESSREGMILVDAAGKIVITNSQVADFFPTVSPYMVNGMDFGAAFAQIRMVLARGGEFDNSLMDAFEHPRADMLFSVSECRLGDGRWLRFSRSATREGGFFLFMIDFTEIKEREERFKEAKRQADAANIAKTSFLANMSHELRTPLNAIIGFSEIISGQMFGSLGSPRYLEYAESILNSGRHLLEVINSVLDLAKNEAGKLEVRPEPFDLRDVIHDCAQMMKDLCARAELRFDVSPMNGPLPIYGEPAKLRQIVLNLLSNAVKFNRPGGSISLTAGAGPAGMTEFCITDTGIGMSPSDIAVALTPFGQVDNRLSRRYEGTGLGLPLTKALVDLHGGTMTIDSALDRGTSVTVVMPAHG